MKTGLHTLALAACVAATAIVGAPEAYAKDVPEVLNLDEFTNRERTIIVYRDIIRSQRLIDKCWDDARGGDPNAIVITWEEFPGYEAPCPSKVASRSEYNAAMEHLRKAQNPDPQPYRVPWWRVVIGKIARFFGIPLEWVFDLT